MLRRCGQSQPSASHLCRLATNGRAQYVSACVPPHMYSYMGQTDDLGPSIFLPLSRVWDEVASKPSFTRQLNRVAVNFGARDGKDDDPLYPLFHDRKFTGLAVELSRSQCSKLRRNLRGVDVECPVGVSPQNVVGLMTTHRIPVDLDVLKLDIDRCEGHLLDIILGSFSPKIINIEVNQFIPPPYMLAEYCGLEARSAFQKGQDGPIWKSLLNVSSSHGARRCSGCGWGSSAAYVHRLVGPRYRLPLMLIHVRTVR